MRFKSKMVVVLSLGFLLSVSSVSLAVQDSEPQPKFVNALDWSTDGVNLAIGYRGGQVSIVDSLSGKEVQIIEYFYAVKAVDWSSTQPNILAVGGRPDGKESSEVLLLDILTGNLQSIYTTGDTITTLAWSPDGTKLGIVKSPLTMSVTSGDELQIWDMSTLKMQVSMLSPGYDHRITSIAWSPDSQRIVGGNTNKTVIIWDATTGNELLVFSEHKDVIRSVDWSPDGSQIITSGSTDDDTVRIWDAVSGENFATFEARGATVRWSPDGHEVAIGENRKVRILDPLNDHELLNVATTSLVSEIDYSPYGGRLVFADEIESSSVSPISTFSDGAVQIIVPNPSPEKLQSILELCGVEASVHEALATQITANELEDFIADVSALTDAQIPVGCKADLLAMARALVAEGE